MKRQPEVTASFDRLTDARLWASSTETAMREGRYIKTKEAQKHSLSDLVETIYQRSITRKTKCE